MIRRAYDWMLAMAGHRRAPEALAAVSFAESSFFPIPPDIMLIPMVLANRAKAWFYAGLCTASSVVGGVAGYAIGYLLFEFIGQPILAFYGQAGHFDEVARWFNEWGAWILIAKGWTPFPYKVLTIFAGAAHMNLLSFIAASIIARAMRFYLVAGLLYWFGEPIRNFIEERLTMLTTLFVIVLVGGFVAVRFVF